MLQAGRDGHLDQRGNVSKFKGVDAARPSGINAALDAVITPTHEAANRLGWGLQQTRQLVDQARQRADTGILGMERLSTATDKIKSASGETAQVVETPGEIVF